MSKPKIFIENWGTVRDDSDPFRVYLAPEIRPRFLTGHIHNHPLKGELKTARTSRIVKYDLMNSEGPRVETVSSIYLLGFPASNFVSMMQDLHGDDEDEFMEQMNRLGMLPDSNGWYKCRPPESNDYTIIGYGLVAGEVDKPGPKNQDRCMTFVVKSKNGDYESQGYHHLVTVTDGYAAWMKVEYWRPSPQLPATVLEEAVDRLMPRHGG